MSDTAQDSRVGSHFGRYRLQRLLGRGGMGEVYQAEDTVKERTIALKLLSPALCEDPVFRERLLREARMAGRLQEPHVVPVHDYGEIDGQLYMDMRLIEGMDLTTLLKTSGPLTPARAVAIVRQAASALDAAHAVDVIHRDVKPENLLITGDDFVYLVDFGIASAATEDDLLQAGTAVASWKYAAPERFTSAEVTRSVDVYALACVLYECLTGSSPYPAYNARALITAHLTEPIPRPSQLRSEIPAAFDAVITRGMAKDPADRFDGAGELARAANAALSARDQDRAGDIVERSQEVTRPLTNVGPPSIHFAAVPTPGRLVPPTDGPPHQHLRGSQSPPATGGVGGPGRVGPATEVPRSVPWLSPGGAGGLLPRLPAPSQLVAPRKRRLWLAVAAAALVVVAVFGGLSGWLLRPSHSATAPGPAAPTPPTAASTLPPAQAEARLLSLLPGGYPPGACVSITSQKDVLAKVSCGQNVDPNGPPSATYELLSDRAAMRAAFDRSVKTSAPVECPGRIQSPGPWRHTTAPKQILGMVLCANRQGYPTVVWTTDAKMLVSIVQGGPQGPTLDQLYTWWSSHS